ncbi:glycosyltransferase family 2 protein [Luteimonas terrae]|uniref:Glycosyltransferase involved in cell wall biosynthesis n=1 Tax=Luteimonas terrae TaxID=1530191 RepID=A0ABU1XZE3_9GAMM|nr:glycosyltransferase family 2 protein [Luteimonas terrae]MDR7194152.1 glycosyltransferase involved in cell wall biosynthesis [Luteimonas terrae]
MVFRVSPRHHEGEQATCSVAVVIPAYRVTRHILGVIDGIPDWVDRIYVVDDHCPDGSGRLVEKDCADSRVVVIFNQKNLGVGGAVMAGYVCAERDGCDIVVKMDGDGQMEPALMPALVWPIASGEADYTKGNRFYDLAQIGRMPAIRIFGNAVLSFMTKISSGYWDLFDPTNGYTAIHTRVVPKLPMHKISHRYFFETDILFRLNTLRAVVVDVPMDARYGDEVSGLSVRRIVLDFMYKHLRNTAKRIFYSYFLRDMSLASIELVGGILMISLGLLAGIHFWSGAAAEGVAASAGRVMLAALPVILGLQLLLGFIAFDIASVPKRAIHRLLR